MPDLKINGTTYAGVTEVQIPLADNSGNAVFVHEGSSEGTVVNGTLLCTVDVDTSMNDLLTAHPIPRKYEKSLVWVKIVGDTAASSGSGTNNWFVFFCAGDSNFVFYNYINSLVAPSSMSSFETVTSKNGNYFSVDTDGSVVPSSLTITTNVIPAGSSVYYLEIPFDYYSFLLNPLS